MSTRSLRSRVLILISALVVGCGVAAISAQNRSDKTGFDAAAIARDVASGVGIVRQTSVGTAPVAAIILEERHNSRMGQLQHALTLARLHERYGLRDIVLEGYLKERPQIDTTWFTHAIGVDTATSRARVAIEFLKQGEISAAEFAKLVYPDIHLIASETEATYLAQLPESIPPVDYLDRIKRVDSAWAALRSKSYDTTEALQSLSGDQHLKLATEIKQYAEAKRIAIPAAEQAAMDQFILFWQKRMASNVTIVGAVPPPLAQSGIRAIGIEIGSFHTAGVSALLKAAQRSYAVVRPMYSPRSVANSNGETRGDLTDEMYERKNKSLSVFKGGVSALILREIPSSLKPEPVLEKEFFQTEGELYAFVTRLAGTVLDKSRGGSVPPPGGRTPPFGLAAGDFDGKRLRITLASVQYLPGQGTKRDALLIPVTFKRSGTTVWVGALLNATKEVPTGVTVEAMLLRALRQVQTEQKTPEQAEDAMGRLKMDDQTLTVVGRDQAAVKKAILSES